MLARRKEDFMSKVVVFLADGFEEIEGLTVVDLLRRADIQVVMASIMGKKNVVGAHGIHMEADALAEEVNFSDTDMIVLPGGMPGTLNLGKCTLVTDKVMEFFKGGKEVAAICAAPSIFGDLGILNGKAATSYPGFEERLTGAKVSTNQVEADGNVTTSRGLGTAIPFALKLIEKLIDSKKAEEINDSIIY